MSKSGEKINYTLRPAKSIERKLMCELFEKSSAMFNISEYRYIGFGSFYFTDFVMMHKKLGIKNMISIESDNDPARSERYKYNCPYSCIKIIFGEATDVLQSEIDWDSGHKDIIWLDYDGELDNSKIQDLDYCIKNVANLSCVAISFSLSLDCRNVELLPLIKEKLGEYLDPNITENDIQTLNKRMIVYLNILKDSVCNAIAAKNLALSDDEEKFKAEQIMNFKYADGKEMMTLAYLITQESEVSPIDVAWNNNTDNPFEIIVPHLTNAELREINKLLPGATLEELKCKMPFIKEKYLENYLKVYKYYPNYFEIDTVI